MRDIKFRRAFFVDEEKTNFSHYTVWGVNIGDTSFTSPSTNNFAYYHKDFQYTGLKDKNGKDIYEGDILQMDVEDCSGKEWKETAQVLWNEDEAAFYSKIIKSKTFRSNSKIGIYPDEQEVIGNIHENPELIK
tara:strand:+ start:25 stop:423 length:399 start_codon:yes stop_codon:yes gene_type:complete